MHLDAIIVFIFFFLLVTVLGFVAARWRRGNLDLISEWGLAGRRFGTVVTWFLLGGDLYTAYTFIAVPGSMYLAGAVSGFFAVPYTVLVYPLIFVLMPRFWTVCKQRGYVTTADFVKDRFGSSSLALAVAFTGILATMPYIALQMFGIQISIAALGIPLTVPILGLNVDVPLIIAFIVLAAYTYSSGLRAPAMIALVKDLMIFIVLIAALIYIPAKLGGFGPIFNAAHQKSLTVKTFFDLIGPNQQLNYVTLALGSALALFLYPHSITGVLSSSSQRVVKRNTALLPIYSLMLGLLALLGYMAIAAKVKPLPGFGQNGAVPALINASFPSWFAGFAFAAISIGALVPAAVMSIAAANTFTRNIYKEYLRRDANEREESQVAKITSFVVKFGALLFIVLINPQQVIFFQLLGGIWILQTLPAVYLGLYTRWFNRWALLVGWAAAMIAGTTLFIVAGNKPSYPILGVPLYTAISALILNLLLAIILTPIFEAIGARRGRDITSPADYDEERAHDEPIEVGREALG
ncbi:MAG: sodium:solute symporter [Chloroflexota bacterium]|nr:sodium:solute symporter [Chloroflexota bacterium]